MNPVEEFYKAKNNYEKLMAKVEHFSTHHVYVTGNCVDNLTVGLNLQKETFGEIDGRTCEDICWMIKAYLEDSKDDIKKEIFKWLKNKMDNAQAKVLEDFKLIGSIKGDK